MARPGVTALSLAALGLTVSIVLIIFGCVEDKKYWLLFMLGPFIFMPAMGMFLSADDEHQFSIQFGHFMIALLTVSSWAMPFVFFSNDGISWKGLLFGIASNISLFGFTGIGICIVAQDDDGFSPL